MFNHLFLIPMSYVDTLPENWTELSENERLQEQKRINNPEKSGRPIIDVVAHNKNETIDLGTRPTGGGLRFNAGKLRHDLVPAFAQEQYVRVLTKGASKYADRNWEAGMKWSTVLASMKRHIAAIEAGEDYDPETGELHAAHVMCNAGFLAQYYKIYPQGDDRPHQYLRHPRVGLDIDEVLAYFIEAYCERYQLSIPTSWNFDTQLLARLDEIMAEDPTFWHNLKPRVSPEALPFEPAAYITARPLNTGVVEWLTKHGFPVAPVVHAAHGPEGKVKACQELGIEIFVDDHYDNFVALNRAGICCYLMDAPHNRRYNVGHKRLLQLADLPFYK